MNWTKLVFYILLAVVAISAIFFYSRVFGYVAMSLILAYLLDPPVTWLERLHIPRWLSIALVYAVILGLVAWLSASFAPELLRQGHDLMLSLDSSKTGTENRLVQMPFLRDIFAFLQNIEYQMPNLDLSARFLVMLDSTQSFLSNLPERILNNINTIIGAVSYIGTVPLISFFLLKDKFSIRKSLISVIPNRYYEFSNIIVSKIDETVGRYMRAMLFEVIAVTFMVSVAMLALGVPNAILIGFVAGVANIIPYFGPFMGAGVAILSVVITGSDFFMIISVLVAMYIVQLIDNNIVYPVVVGKTINMHPLIVLLTVLAGGWFGGILWMLLSVPVVFICYSIVTVSYTNLKRFRLI